MEKSEYKINIIGGGISGLIAARVLEANGYHPQIIEASDRVGGRVKTDIIDGFQLDHGFQVLLDAYPKVEEYLDIRQLSVSKLKPGAVLFYKTGREKIGDPLRSLSLLYPTLTASAGTFQDKWNIFKLNRHLQSKTVEEIFESPEKTTLQYLQDIGFSQRIIESFFRPFFAGIFLETQLQTSSRMFEFVYKMFGEGHAVLPKEGMEAIPRQLKAGLKHSQFHFNTKVKEVREGEIELMDGKTIPSHFTIIATDPTLVLPNLKGKQDWKSCFTLYFRSSYRVVQEAMIGLVSVPGALVNNIFYHNSIDTDRKGDGELLSVTIVKDHKLEERALVDAVMKELEQFCGITDLEFLKMYSIPKALPRLTDLQNDVTPTETRLTSTIFLAGDQQLNASLNGAMTSGERAAQGVINTLEEGLRVGRLTSEFR